MNSYIRRGIVSSIALLCLVGASSLVIAGLDDPTIATLDARSSKDDRATTAIRASAPTTTATAVATADPPISTTATTTGTLSLPDLVIEGTGGREIGYIGCAPPWPSYELSVTIGNIGDAPAGAFVLRVGGRDLDIEGLRIGATKAVTLSWDLSEQRILVDAEDAVLESDESNNERVIPRPPPPSRPPPCLPDLLIRGYIQRYEPDHGVCIPYHANLRWGLSITNRGAAAAGRFVTRAGNQVWSLDGLEAGASAALIGDSPGSVVAMIDADEEVAESNENNNTYLVTTPVPLTSPPYCTPTAVVTPSPPPLRPAYLPFVVQAADID